MSDAEPRPADAPEAPPPILGSWRRVYVVMAAQLGVVILALYALSWWAS